MKKRLFFTLSAFLILGLTFGMSYMHKVSATVPGVNQLINTDSSGAHGNAGISMFGSLGSGPRASGNGRYIAYDSNDSNLVPNDTNDYSDVFVKDTQTGTTTLASIGLNGMQLPTYSVVQDISYDGRYVLFAESSAHVLILRDTINNTSTLVCKNDSVCNSVSGKGGAISADGRYVTWANRDYPGHVYQAVLMDVQDNIFKVLSVDSSGGQGIADSSPGDISCDGGVIGFYSGAGNLPGGGNRTFIATLDPAGNVHLTSEAGTYYNTDVSCDGNYLVSWGGSGSYSIVKEINRLSGQINTIVPYGGVSSNTSGASISNGGRYIAVATNYNLDSSYPSTGAYSQSDAYVLDTKNSTLQLLSYTVAGNKSGSINTPISISADGSKVVYGYYTPSSTDTTHELISGLNTGTSNHQLDVYTSQTGF